MFLSFNTLAITSGTLGLGLYERERERERERLSFLEYLFMFGRLKSSDE